VRRAHGALQVHTLHLLPVLGQERDEEVHGEDDVLGVVLDAEGDVSDTNTQAGGLLALQLELDGALQVVDVLGHAVGGDDDGRELAGFVQAGA